MYKHKKSASQFIIYVPIDPIGSNLVSLIRKSESHLQTNFWSEAHCSSHCYGRQILRKMQNIAFLTSRSSGYSIWINKARIWENQHQRILTEYQKRFISPFTKKVPCKIKTRFWRFQHHSVVVKWIEIRCSHQSVSSGHSVPE